jgi:hypothetical protein
VVFHEIRHFSHELSLRLEELSDNKLTAKLSINSTYGLFTTVCIVNNMSKTELYRRFVEKRHEHLTQYTSRSKRSSQLVRNHHHRFAVGLRLSNPITRPSALSSALFRGFRLCGCRPRHHLLRFRIPLMHSSSANVILVVILRTALDHGFPKGNVDPSLARLRSCALWYTVEPVRLRLAAHQDHISWAQWQFDALWLLRHDAFLGWDGLVFHEEVALRTETERRDRRVGTKEPFIVRVVRYAIFAVGVVVYKTKVEGFASGALGHFLELLQTLWDRAGCALVASLFDRLSGLCVYDAAIRCKPRCIVDTEHGSESWGIDLCLRSAASDIVLHAIEGKFLAQKLEEPWRNAGRYIRLIVHEVQIQLIVHELALLGRCEAKLLCEKSRQMRNGEGIRRMA